MFGHFQSLFIDARNAPALILGLGQKTRIELLSLFSAYLETAIQGVCLFIPLGLGRRGRVARFLPAVKLSLSLRLSQVL